MKTLFAVAMFTMCGVAVAQGPLIHAHFEPAGNAIVGEPVRLVVTVLVPNYFTGSPDFPEFELENVIVVLPQETPRNSSERKGAVTYAGITEIYTLYPQQPGEYSLPPVQIDVPYAIAPPKTVLVHLTLPSLKLRANIPAAAEGLDYFLPTTRLTIQQRWSPEPKALRVGDTFERTITVTAVKMQAMLIPPLLLDAPDGIRVYQEEPSVQDKKSNRNEFLFGQRVQSAKYLIQKEGGYTLPAIELKWWNLSTRRLMTAVLPAVHFEVAPNPNAAAELAPEQPPPVIAEQTKIGFWARYKRQLCIGAIFLLAGLLLLWSAWRWLPVLIETARNWRAQRRESEKAYFGSLVKACSADSPRETYAALLQWLNRISPGRSINEAYAAAQDAELSSEIDRLGAVLFSSGRDGAAWSGQRLAELLKAWRKQRYGTSAQKSALAKLNP